ncbi:MAG: energy-coupling factor transporter transmembrane protein EcfT [Treponema sp.]|jgi:energy-coupling factor transporter transmembrane protein EcfT|nr:energy-coupling factor transporter transmembrane protein EcfT [Treponema sp.]
MVRPWETLPLGKCNKVQALYPSVKLLITGLYLFCSAVLSTIRLDGYPVFAVGWFFILPLLARMSGIFRVFCRDFLKIFLVSLFILLVQCFSFRGGEILASFAFLKFYKAGLIKGMILGFSIMNTAGVFLWMFKTMENRELAFAIDAAGMNRMASFVFMSSLGMIRTLERSSRIIMDAQRARGLETQGNILVRARAFSPILIPLILSAVTSAEERALTLEARGFDVPGTRTHIFTVAHSPYDRAARRIALGITACVVGSRIALWLL